MTAASHEPHLIGAYVLGGLDAAERAAVESHLAGCTRCRAEAAELGGVVDMLADLPPELLIEAPPDADLSLHRTLRRMREESSGARRRRAAWGGSAAAVLLAVAVGVGVVVGERGTPSPGAQAVPTSSAPAPAPPSGTRAGTVLDPDTGVRLTAAVLPAAGWVRVNVTVNGIPAGEDCRLFVVGRDGRREVAGGWVVSPAGEANGTNLDGSASIPIDEVTAVEVRNAAGRTFAVLRL